jgi:peptidoglycan/LPS O-acetylase OafA/YrhL
LFSIPFPVALLLVGLINEEMWLSRLLSTRLAQLLGKASYVLYLFHLTPMTRLFTEYVSKNLAGYSVSNLHTGCNSFIQAGVASDPRATKSKKVIVEKGVPLHAEILCGYCQIYDKPRQ